MTVPFKEKDVDPAAIHPLSLEVSLSRREVFIGEPIYLHVRLKNVSDGDLPVVPLKVSSSDIGGNLGVIMSREDGVREYHPPYVEATLTSISQAAEFLPLLEPGGSWIVVVDLLSYFSEEKELVSRPEDRIRIGAGTYQLKAFYRWDYRPSVVVGSNTLQVRVSPPPMRERWKKSRIERAIRRRRSRRVRNGPVERCRAIYSWGYTGLVSGDLIREGVKEGLEKDLLGTIGAFYVIEENQVSPPYFLYDLITYRESLREDDKRDYRRFLDELIARWPDGFLGEVARQKKTFERIALGGVPSAARPKRQ